MPSAIEDEVERVEKVTGRLMRAVNILAKVGPETDLRVTLGLIERARRVAEDVDWVETVNALEFYCDGPEE